MLNIKKESRWHEAGAVNKNPKAPAEWRPLFEAIGGLDEGEIVSLAVTSDKEARAARHGLMLWRKADAFIRNGPSTIGYKSRLFRYPGGGLKLKFRRVEPKSMKGAGMTGKTREQYRQQRACGLPALPPLPDRC
jgi:hypothetical protein